MELSKKKILREWLEIEFNNTAAKTGYIPDAVGIASKDLIFRTIRILDKETTKNSNIDRNYIISIIAMLWEHVDHEIEDTIEVLQNIVSYNLPLLLKPIFDIKQPDNMILASLQSGTSDPYVVCMVEMGIPRETALYIKEKLKKEFEQVDASSEAMRSIIQKSVTDFPYWIKVQLRFLG